MEHWSGDTCCMYKGFCSQIHFAGVLICDKVWLKKKEFRFTYHMGHFFPEWRTVANQRKVNGFEPSFPTDYNSGAKNIDLGQINSHFFPSILLLFSLSWFIITSHLSLLCPWAIWRFVVWTLSALEVVNSIYKSS